VRELQPEGATAVGEAVVRAVGLEKRYGLRTVLRDVSFELESGGALVVTGPNGAGKSTLLRLIGGLAAPSRGLLEIGIERRRVGFLAHEPLVYRELTALENLDLYGRLYGVPERRERIGMLLERFDLWDARHQRISSYSRGMTQRLALCRALLHEPDLVVLDEPHASLDDEGLALLDAELGTLATAGKTLVVATHDPARVAALATGSIVLGRA